MKRLLALAIGLLLLVPSLLALTSLRRGVTSERLGYRPAFELMYFSSLEHRLLLSQLLFYDAVFYYGSLAEQRQDQPQERPDYLMIGRYVDSATRLNVYNIDAYYFGQAILTWEAGMVKDMNLILQRGLKARPWDFYLPFFLGFNYAHFLNDYEKAGDYLQIAAKLNPKMEFLPTLVGRYYHEAKKTEQALDYLKVVYQGTRNETLKKEIMTRITALETISFLEEAVEKFQRQTGRPPEDLEELTQARILKAIPPDPYGGVFYYDRRDGRVKTTSKMAFQGEAHDRN